MNVIVLARLLKTLFVALTLGVVLTTTAYGQSADDIKVSILVNLDRARADIWQKATQRGVSPTVLRQKVGAQKALEFDQHLWPLQRNSFLDGLADSLNLQNLKAGEFSRMMAASLDPGAVAIQAGYRPAEIDILYAVTAYPVLADAAQAGSQLWDFIVDEELAHLMAGQSSLLFASATAEVGLALSGQQLYFEGVPYYTYILTIIVARPQMAYPIDADAFLTDGQYLGQPGLPVFDARFYLQANPDLLTAMGRDYQAALVHWQKFGRLEGRQGSAVFDPHYYLEANPDLKAVFGTNYPAAISHWLRYGMREGRPTTPTFDARAYLQAYGDLRNAYGQDYQAATWHYLTWGMLEGR